MQLKINPIIAIIILLGLVLILIALFNGCHNNASLQDKLTISNVAFDSLKIKNERDSMASIENEKSYKDSLAFTNGQLDLRQNKLDATEATLLATAKDYSILKKKYEQVRADTNTSVTLVPNEFINDCHDCFDSLDFKNRLIKIYVRQVKDVDSAHRTKEKLQENRIKQLGQERDGAFLSFNDCLSIANTKLKALQPRRKILLSIGTIAVSQVYPTGVGAGLMYQDKHNRLFGAKGFATNVGPIYTAEISLPLSLKRK